MTILSAQTLRRRRMIAPHHERTRCPRTGMTFGLSAAGYDVRIAEAVELWPRHEEKILWHDETTVVGNRRSFKLASTMEHFNIGTDVLGRVHDKSTLARRGLTVKNTVAEPGWRGYLTLELSNDGYEVLRFEPGDPIAQIVFEYLDEATDSPYEGRYQDQRAGPQEAMFLDGKEELI